MNINTFKHLSIESSSSMKGRRSLNLSSDGSSLRVADKFIVSRYVGRRHAGSFVQAAYVG